MNQHYFDVPFAFAGDQTAIPDPLQVGGTVSMTEGWNFNYQRNLSTDPAALPIDRSTTNWILNQITTALQALQQQGVPEWITAAQNGGVAYSYGKGAVVLWSASGNAPFSKYVNLTAGNTATPSVSDPQGLVTGWQIEVDPISTAAQASAGTDDASIMTPLKVASQVALRALLAGNASQVFNVANASSASQAVAFGQLPLLASGIYGIRRFVGANNATTPATKFDMYCDSVCLRNTTTGAIVGAASGATITNDATLAGPAANGRDQAATFGNGWVHFYYIWNGAALATISSNNAPPAGPTLPAGYTHWAYAGAVYFNTSTGFALVRQRGAWCMYADYQSAVAGGTSTSVAAIAITTLSPPNAAEFELIVTNLSVLAAANTAGTIQLNLQVEAGHLPSQIGIQGVGASSSPATVATSGASKRFSALSQGFNYQLTNIVGSSQNVSIAVTGYSVPNGGE